LNRRLDDEPVLVWSPNTGSSGNLSIVSRPLYPIMPQSGIEVFRALIMI